jgi:hypothetical protein
MAEAAFASAKAALHPGISHSILDLSDCRGVTQSPRCNILIFKANFVQLGLATLTFHNAD